MKKLLFVLSAFLVVGGHCNKVYSRAYEYWPKPKETPHEANDEAVMMIGGTI